MEINWLAVLILGFCLLLTIESCVKAYTQSQTAIAKAEAEAKADVERSKQETERFRQMAGVSPEHEEELIKQVVARLAEMKARNGGQ